MNLTIFGATGGVGREVVSQALDAGHHVTAYVRTPAKLSVTHPALTVAAGELTDRDAVQRAVHGADAVISALGPSLDRKATGMPLVDGTRTIVDAMRAEGVERYIGMATPSLRDARDIGSLLGRLVPFMGRTFLARAYRELLEMSQIVTESDLDWTIARFTPAQGRGPQGHGTRRLSRPRQDPGRHHPRRHRRLPARPDHRHALPARRPRDQQLTAGVQPPASGNQGRARAPRHVGAGGQRGRRLGDPFAQGPGDRLGAASRRMA